MRAPAICMMALLVVAGCGGDDDDGGGTAGRVSTTRDGGAGRRRCVDNDGDGYGDYCLEGDDCDDTDPEQTNQCRVCNVPNTNCDCEPGTKPVHCDPDDVMVTRDGKVGVLVCSEGTRYCRDGIWSECEILFQYATFVPSE